MEREPENNPTTIPLWQAWGLAIRIKTLPAVIAPIILSQFLAWEAQERFSWLIALTIFICALLLQIAVNLANDVFDYESGVDSAARLGPPRATQSGWLSPVQMKFGLALVLSLACMTGLVLVYWGGWLYLLLGLLSVLAALAYSGGPYPLASNALGEVTVFLFFGLLAVAGGFHLQTGKVTCYVASMAVCMGSMTAAIMLVNNLRDFYTDSAAGKHTLVVQIGQRYTRVLYLCLLLPPVAWLAIAGVSWILVAPLSMIALLLIAAIYVRKGSALNHQLAQTALFCLIYSLVVVTDHWL